MLSPGTSWLRRTLLVWRGPWFRCARSDQRNYIVREATSGSFSGVRDERGQTSHWDRAVSYSCCSKPSGSADCFTRLDRKDYWPRTGPGKLRLRVGLGDCCNFRVLADLLRADIRLISPAADVQAGRCARVYGPYPPPPC